MANQHNGVRLGLELEFMIAHHIDFYERNCECVLPDKIRHDGRFPDTFPHPTSLTHPWDMESDCVVQVSQAIADCDLPVAIRLRHPGLDDALLQTLRNAQASSELHRMRTNKRDFLSPKCPYRIWNRDKVSESKMHNPRYDYWYVTTEPCMTHNQAHYPSRNTPKGPYHWYALEINSPAAPNADVLCQDLTKIFASLRNRTKIWPSSACGMHIHASPSSQKLTLPIAKKVVALVAILEKNLIKQIIHPARQSSYNCRRITEDSRIALDSYGFIFNTDRGCADAVRALTIFHDSAKTRTKEEPAMYKFLLCVFNQLSEKRLRNGLHRHKVDYDGSSIDAGRCGLDISHFGTIEFRYMHASFDMTYISFWIELIMSLFSIATKSNTEYCKKFIELYDMATSQQKSHWTRYLDVLGLSHRTEELRAYVKKFSSSLKDLDKQPILPKVNNPPSLSRPGTARFQLD